MRSIWPYEQDAERAFAEAAAEHFRNHPKNTSYTVDEIDSGEFLALRWGLDDDGVLVLKVSDGHTPANYMGIAKRHAPINAAEAGEALVTALKAKQAEAEPTIDEIVGKATRFEFRTAVGDHRAAVKGIGNYWRVHGFDYRFTHLTDMQKRFGIQVGSIVPLVIDPAWIEARR